MKKYLFLFLFSYSNIAITAQNTYFFPTKKLNPNIPSPEQFLGYGIGTHHTRHDKLVEYMKELDRVSDKVSVQKIGETYEHRDQIIVTITSQTNFTNLEQIRKQHLELCDATKPIPDIKKMPSVVWLGYNVHGNEPSSSEAAMLTAYYLVASEEPEMQEWLSNAVILMEPVINPDGRDRHSFWADANKGTPLVADANDREHNEAWPGGRTNHYWFDLNRDWFLAIHPESRNRLNFYHQWLPNVVTDFHEMGTNSTHFFEPSKENAENPMVPKAVYRDLNVRFAKYFEEALNSIGSLYYTKESFDNFYPGYGSSYPDLEGGLGLLFEQASSRGHLQESQNGNLSFAFTVRNQLMQSLATVKASINERELLLKHQNNFFKSVTDQAQKSTTKTYIIGDNADETRNRAFWDLLLQHKIEFYHLADNISQNNQTFDKGKAVIIPTNQPQYLMVRSIFDRPKTFADSLFYDASTWNLALSYGLPHSEITGTFQKGNRITKADLVPNLPTFAKSNYAYLIDYSDYNATKTLYQLLDNDILTKVSTKPFSMKMENVEKKYGYGTLIIPVQSQKVSADELFQKLTKISKSTNLNFIPISTGFSNQGIDLGSNLVVTVKKPEAMMLVGTGISQAEAGEVWHLLDTKIGMPITKVDINSFGRLNIKRYNTIVLVGGNYTALDKTATAKLKAWVALGGTLITQKSASEWAIKNEIIKEKMRELKPDTSRTKPRINYDDFANAEGAKATGGAIFEVDLDISHPIGFGYKSRKIAIYRNGNTMLEPSTIAANTVTQYATNPWICGYVHKDALKKMSNSAGILIANEGAGRVILFSDNPNFRGTWFGTNKLFFNALFFGANISAFRGFDGEEEK